MRIPKIEDGILDSVGMAFDKNHPGYNPEVLNNMMKKILTDNPNLYAMFMGVHQKYGNNALISVLFIYRMLESQLEANELKEMYNEDA